MRIRPESRKRWLTVWDCGKFFQTRFDLALASAGIDSGNIAEMKERRASFSDSDSEEIREYCLLECRQLALLVDALNEAHEQAEIPLTSWYGPGSAASVLLKRMNIDNIRGETPKRMKRAVSRAFFGGRFEHSAIGRIEGPIFSADIISAYPAQCLLLPCLEHARWIYTTRERELEGVEQACVEFELVDSERERKWGPLPIRMPDGTITYPSSGANGQCWLAEFRAAKRWPNVRFLSAWILQRDCDCKPFTGIRHAFDTRIAVGKNTAVGGALKRAINSVYGKLAQTVGNPPFRSQEWAGMITSGCRAELLDVLWEHDADILAVATDGVYSRVPMRIPTEREGTDLGCWELGRAEEITLVRPGIYWTDNDVRSRGIPRSVVSAEKACIAAALERREKEVVIPPLRQFGAASSMIYPTRNGFVRSPRYGEWYTRPAKVSFSAAPKRMPDWMPWVLDGVDSAPYKDGDTPERMLAKLLRSLKGELL